MQAHAKLFPLEFPAETPARRRIDTALEPWLAAFPDRRRTVEWLDYMVVGPGGRWIFKPNGKAATSTALAALFALEYGVPLSARLATVFGVNQDQAVHALTKARVFARTVEAADMLGSTPEQLLAEATRITTTRHPLDRAISGFLYLCQSNELAKEQFGSFRLRLSARTGLDWTRHAGTREGMLRFLDHLSAEIEEGGAHTLDSHFRPQVLNIRPDLFSPDIVGRVEDMQAFFDTLSSRLDRPIPEAGRTPRNVGTKPKVDLHSDREIRQRVSELFAEDFEAFDYAI